LPGIVIKGMKFDEITDKMLDKLLVEYFEREKIMKEIKAAERRYFAGRMDKDKP